MVYTKSSVDSLLKIPGKASECLRLLRLLNIHLTLLAKFGIAGVHLQSDHILHARKMKLQAKFVSAHIGQIYRVIAGGLCIDNLSDRKIVV